MDLVVRLLLLVLLWAALIDLLRRGSLRYPSARDVAWVATEGAVFAICSGVLVDANFATITGWAASCGVGFGVLVALRRDPQTEGAAEPPLTSETGNRIAFVGGLLIVGLLLGAGWALEGWPAYTFLVMAALLVARLLTTRRKTQDVGDTASHRPG